MAVEHVVIFGRPGSGKSSLAERLGADFGFRLVRTGELLREAVRRRDPIGLRVESQLSSGRLVADDLIADLLESTLVKLVQDRFIFDGFPRTMGQVPVLKRLEAKCGFTIDAYIDVYLTREVASLRMTGRRVCPLCAATYHLQNRPPIVANICDHDGTTLISRADDSPEVVSVRQEIYDTHSGPLLEHYRQSEANRFQTVDGSGTFEQVYQSLCLRLGLKV